MHYKFRKYKKKNKAEKNGWPARQPRPPTCGWASQPNFFIQVFVLYSLGLLMQI